VVGESAVMLRCSLVPCFTRRDARCRHGLRIHAQTILRDVVSAMERNKGTTEGKRLPTNGFRCSFFVPLAIAALSGMDQQVVDEAASYCS